MATNNNTKSGYLFEGDAFFNPQLQLEDGEKKRKVCYTLYLSNFLFLNFFKLPKHR